MTTGPSPGDARGRGPGRPPRPSRTGLVWIVGGFTLWLVAFICLGPMQRELSGTRDRVIAGALGVTCFWAATTLVRRGKKLRAPTGEMVREGDPRPPVIYLRAFRDDPRAARRVGGVGMAPESPLVTAVGTEEEQLAEVMNEIGPFVAIGKPGDKLPQLGAARMYVSDDEWQATVTRLMDEARLVVLRAADSEGLLWEVQQTAKRLPPERLLFVVPLKGRRYDGFRRRADGYLPRPLPRHPGGRRWASIYGLVYFERDWTSRFAKLRAAFFRSRARKPLVAKLKFALRPVFDQLGVPWVRPGINWWRVLLVSWFLFMGATSAVVGILIWSGVLNG